MLVRTSSACTDRLKPDSSPPHLTHQPGERFNATEATRLGLIQGSFETVEELDKAVDSVLTVRAPPLRDAKVFVHASRCHTYTTHTEQEIKANSPAAMRSCKQLINNVYHSLGSPKKGEGLSDVKAPLPPFFLSFFL